MERNTRLSQPALRYIDGSPRPRWQRMLDAWFAPKPFESPALYERLGVLFIKRYAPTGGDFFIQRHGVRIADIRPNLDSLIRFEGLTRPAGSHSRDRIPWLPGVFHLASRRSPNHTARSGIRSCGLRGADSVTGYAATVQPPAGLSGHPAHAGGADACEGRVRGLTRRKPGRYETLPAQRGCGAPRAIQRRIMKFAASAAASMARMLS